MDTFDDLLALLQGAPVGDYLVEEADGLRRLWLITGTEPDDATLAPAADMMLLPALTYHPGEPVRRNGGQPQR